MITQLLYTLNRRAPALFAPIRLASGMTARMVHGRSIGRARANAEIAFEQAGVRRVLRPLTADDVGPLSAFLAQQEQARFSFFRPHGFDRGALARHLNSPQFLSYGLFENDQLVAYGLIRITPTRAAFLGSMVAETHGGRGVGKLMARYLYWQTAAMGLDNYLTISTDNPASLRSHSPGRELEKVQTLNEDGYALYRAPQIASDLDRPDLQYRTGARIDQDGEHGS